MQTLWKETKYHNRIAIDNPEIPFTILTTMAPKNGMFTV